MSHKPDCPRLQPGYAYPVCLATWAAYGACVREPGHELPHRNAFGYEFSQDA